MTPPFPFRPPLTPVASSLLTHPLQSVSMSSELIRADTTTLPLAEIASALYNIDDHIFENMYLNFSELSTAAQKLLTESGLYPINPAVGEDHREDHYQQPLLALRKARQERLGRTLEGVNRALIYGLIANNPTLHTQFTSAFNVKSNIADVARLLPSLQGVLVPELQGHLDGYMEEIDALLWFEVTLRKNSKNPMTKAQVLAAREAEVQHMTAFVLRRLQRANEKVQDEIALAETRGIRGANARETLLLAQGDDTGHFSDHDSDESDFDYEGEDLGFWTGAKVVGSPVRETFDGRHPQTVN